MVVGGGGGMGSSNTLWPSTLSVPSVWKNTSSYQGLLPVSVLMLLFTYVAASSSRILTDWKKHPIYQFWFIAALWQPDSKMKLKTDLRDTEGPSMHYLQGLVLLYFSHSKHRPWLSSQGIVPNNPSPSTILWVWGDKDTALVFTCISQTEPQSRDWLLNGPSALCLG